jgi:hypothetical protein
MHRNATYTEIEQSLPAKILRQLLPTFYDRRRFVKNGVCARQAIINILQSQKKAPRKRSFILAVSALGQSRVHGSHGE